MTASSAASEVAIERGTARPATDANTDAATDANADADRATISRALDDPGRRCRQRRPGAGEYGS
ncbi:hypothetical protein ACH4VR_15750 [Streptomyces sp. NPDC020883]|uniref:hypothetical protein n=1 Tax=Streptomyces sp. NPDC020883 TaxID=3365099 RepID=UPI00379C2105